MSEDPVLAMTMGKGNLHPNYFLSRFVKDSPGIVLLTGLKIETEIIVHNAIK